MKNMLIIIQVVIMVFLAKLFSGSSSNLIEYMPSNTIESVPITKVSSISIAPARKEKPSVVTPSRLVNSKELVEFFKETAETRIMALEEGKLAAKRGTTVEIRNYGKLMVKDQSKMLEELKTLARIRHIDLPKKLSDDKTENLNELKQTDDDFDKKFIKMIKNDHKRDIRKFKSGADSEDSEVARLSNKYRPIVKSHLDKVKSL